MHAALLVESAGGKRSISAVGSAAAAETSCRLFVADRITGRRFLIDTGADVSVVPAMPEDRHNLSPITLSAINRSSIRT